MEKQISAVAKVLYIQLASAYGYKKKYFARIRTDENLIGCKVSLKLKPRVTSCDKF